MMFWYGHGVSGWGWFAMSAGMIVFWAVIITVAMMLFRSFNSPREDTHAHTPTASTPEDILRERLARGEIDEEEYRRRLSTLHAGPLSKT